MVGDTWPFSRKRGRIGVTPRPTASSNDAIANVKYVFTSEYDKLK